LKDNKLKKWLTQIKDTILNNSAHKGGTLKDKYLKEMVEEIKKKFNVSLTDTFLDEIDNPKPILYHMINIAMNWHHPKYDCWAIGKELQHKHRGKIPFKTELEVSAGLWYLIYKGKV
jgi:hypothetical protein